jgi:protein-tyrosine-phosphatase
MAAGVAPALGASHVLVHSAGSAPGETLNPAVVAAMAEVGVDIANETPKQLTDEMGRSADVVVTMGCGDACPVYPGKRYVDWELEDPKGKDLAVVRGIRDEIRGLVASLIEELTSASSGPS